MVFLLRSAGQRHFGLYWHRVLENGRIPLVHVPADEAIEVLEAKSGGPKVERAGSTRLPGGDIVILAKPPSAVAILPEHLADRSAALGHYRVVARITQAAFHNHAGVGVVVIAAGDQCGARRRTQPRRMEAVVLEAAASKFVECWGGNGA